MVGVIRDTPPGHRRYRFGSWGQGDPNVVVPWHGEPGDVIVQHGPRLGQRFWMVIDVEPLVKWATVLVRPALFDEVLVAIDEGAGQWLMRPRSITPVIDIRHVLL